MDDCWSSTTRNASGSLQPDPTQFPSGFNALTGDWPARSVRASVERLHHARVSVLRCIRGADYVHSKGLKIGLYTCIGTKTCHGGRPGSFGFYEQDAQTIAAWGMDVSVAIHFLVLV
jgi:alpha-galactosidase